MWHPDSIYDVNGHLDEGVIHAWLDGELAPADGHALEEHATACSVCAARVTEARGLVAGSSRVLSALDQADGQRVAPRPMTVGRDVGNAGRTPMTVGHADVATRRRRWTTRRLSLAAAAALVFAAGTVVLRNDGGDTVVHESLMMDSAKGSLAPAPLPQDMPGQGGARSAGPVENGIASPGAQAASGRRSDAAANTAANAAANTAANSAANATAEAAVTNPAVRSERPPPPPVSFARAPSGLSRMPISPGEGSLIGSAARPSVGFGAGSPAGSAGGSAAGALAGASAGLPASADMAAAQAPAPTASPSPQAARMGSQGRMRRSAVTATGAATDTDTATVEKSEARTGSIYPANVLMVSECWRVGASDSVLRFGNDRAAAELTILPAARARMRLEAADSLPVVRLWPADSAVSDRTVRVIDRNRLVAVGCP